MYGYVTISWDQSSVVVSPFMGVFCICVGTCIKNGRDPEASKYMQVSDESGALLLCLSDSVEGYEPGFPLLF